MNVKRAVSVLAGLAVIGSVAWAGVAGATTATPAHGPCRSTKPAVGVSKRVHDGVTQASLCVRGTRKADSTVTVSRDPRKHQAYAIYQGKRGDAIPPGYVGADNQHGVTLVGCDTGTYNPDANDEWNQNPHSPNNNAQIALGTDEFTAPTGPIGPGDPCSPFVPHTPPGKSCGSAQTAHPATVAPKGSPLKAYSESSPRNSLTTRSGQAGIAGDFGGGDGASGYLQVTYRNGRGGNVTTGGNSRGGGGTVAVGNDGNETDDPWTPKQSPVVLCQD
jgi:hypothetical protein